LTNNQVETMFCSNCGTKSAENAKFCASCGSAIAAAPAKKTAASRTKKIEPAAELVVDVAPVAEAPEFETPAQPASPLAKLTANKPLLIGAPVVIVALIAAFVFFVKPGGPTEANVAEYMVTASSVSFDADQDTTADFSGQVLEDCPVDAEITALFASGTTWAEGGISSPDGADVGFHLKQRIFEASSDADVASLKSLLGEVATTSACDSSSSTSLMSYNFDYTNGRTINEAYGVNLDGWVIDMNFEICMTTCTTTESSILVANRGRVVELIEFGGADERMGELNETVTNLLKKFAG
jgi:hypothetical protein